MFQGIDVQHLFEVEQAYLLTIPVVAAVYGAILNGCKRCQNERAYDTKGDLALMSGKEQHDRIATVQH